jgi:hypothetical protein
VYCASIFEEDFSVPFAIAVVFWDVIIRDPEENEVVNPF